jgi:hypothetical protein
MKPNKYAHLADGTVIVMLERNDGTVLACRIGVADWERVQSHRWYAKKGRNTFYAVTNMRKPNGKRTTLRMHRLLLPDAVEVDHRAGDGLNNRRTNLRPATSSQNRANSRKRSDGVTSHYRGVSRTKDRKQFRANIKVNRRTHHLGCFTNEEDAARAYDEAALKYFGEFAKLNDVQPAQLKKAA